jgi:hypothetical protein
VALTAAALAGCDAVSSKVALFGPADAAKTPLKPGLWAAIDPEKSCSFDEKRPVDAWPDSCVLPIEVRATDVLLYRKEKGKPGQWGGQAAYMLVGGDPLIMQTYMADGGEFDFYVVSADHLDAEGRITAARVRGLLCGPTNPPASGAPPASQPSGRTTPLYPGLTATGSSGCTPNGADGLRQAIRASADQPTMPAHWVRDGWR